MFSPEFLHYPGSHELPRDFMALFHDSIMAEREGEREMERRKRQAQLERKQQAEKLEAAEQHFVPIFSAPVRTHNVDDITTRVFNTLGEFSNVRNNLVDASTQRHLLGIPKGPMTPVDNKTQARFPPALGLNGKVNNLCPTGVTKQPNEMQTWRNAAGVGQSRPGPAGASNRPANSASAGHKTTDGNKSNDNSPFKTQNASSHTASKQGGNDRQNTKTSDKTKPSNRGQSKSRTAKSSAADAKSSESHSGPPNGAVYTKIKKEFGPRDSSQHQKYDAKKQDSRRIGQDEPDGMQKKVESKPLKSIFDDDEFERPIKQEKPRPRLDIPRIMEPNTEKVESILNFMTDIKSPVTAIQTPIKGDASSKFPFSLVDKIKGQRSGLKPILEVKAITPLDSGNKLHGKTLTDVNNRQASGEESEDSDNEDVNKNREEQKESMTTTTIGKTSSNAANEGELEGEASGTTANMDINSRVSDSSSESSSSESEGSGSEESETESEGSAPESEEDEQPVKQPAKFGLLNVIEKVKTQAKSPATLGGKPQFMSNSSAPGNSPLSSRTSSNGDSFPSKMPNIKLGSKHGENRSGFGMDPISFTASKYSGNFDKYASDANENDMANFNQHSKESKIERASVNNPAVKAKGPKKVPVKNNSLKSTSAKGETKGDSKKEKVTKTKISRQSSSNGPVEGKPKNSAKSTPKSDKKSKMPSDGRGRKKKGLPLLPKSREFIESDSSDSEAESVSRSPTKSPCKVNGTSVTDSTHSSLSPKLSACSKSSVSKGGKNKIKLERNAVYSVSSLDDVFDEPLLSPLKSPDLMSEITYKSGIPSLIVRFDLSDISNLPHKNDGRTHSRTSSSPVSKRDVSDGLDERLPPLVKSKRKTEDMDPEILTSRGESNKKPKNESSSKSPRTLHIKEEPQHNESLIPESDTVLDRRRPYERRSSITSVSSHHSSSGRSSKSDKDHPPNKRRKRDHAPAEVSAISETNLVNHNKHQSIDWLHNEERTESRDSSNEVLNDTECHRNGHKNSADEWGAEVEGAFQPHMKRFLPDSRHRPNFADERQLTADDYLNEGKKLKRLADAQADKNVKALTYFDAVLSFILCGHTMENDPHIPGEKAVTMYNETCEIIKFILKFKGTHQDATYNTDKKLAVLCHRCQALLYTRMFKLKKPTAMKMSRALGEHFKSQNKCQGAQAPSPWNSTKYTGTPSPMSPTPSPAGSVGSVGSLGSQGSNNCSDLSSSQNLSQNKLTNGVAGPMSSPAAITLPQRIMDMMSRFLVFSNYSLYGLDFWEQSELMAQEHPEFFQELDQQCGPLTLHSSTLELVRYARNGLHRLKKS
ncbi:uncharacterized protein [Amphiura filiformis]|uniref:uncharacterized protein isoform X2 n=1 Tax=Amphiura filiformis TaxID=82378 RepID=UPI003B2157DB